MSQISDTAIIPLSQFTDTCRIRTQKKSD